MKRTYYMKGIIYKKPQQSTWIQLTEISTLVVPLAKAFAARKHEPIPNRSLATIPQPEA